MNARSPWPRILLIAGFVGMLVGAVDALEGSLLILPGTGMVSLGAFLGTSRYRKLLCWAVALVAAGVGALWVLSAFGGVRLHAGDTGHSIWWGLFLLPYPAGWILGVIGAILLLAESFRNPVLHREEIR
ncbi:MAG: hypothetical protein L0Z52_13025 [Acidobacteria bacterium]|nr:hypothetical protein [Acidobacteriota bacterium]